MLEAVVFDLDGTMWDSSSPVASAWNTVLEKHEDISLRLKAEDIWSYMGKTIDVIAGLVFPDMNADDRMAVVMECIGAENRWLSQHGGTLYDGLENTLTELKQKYRLFIVSNCQEGYIEAFLGYHGLGNYFDDYEMYGRTNRSKGDNIRAVIDRNKIESTHAVYIGDTQSDLEAAEAAGVRFIHAAYGFGSINRETPYISSIKQLPVILKTL